MISNPIRSDEGLTLETSAFQIFHGGNFTFINSFDKTKVLYDFRPDIYMEKISPFWLVKGSAVFF